MECASRELVSLHEAMVTGLRVRLLDLIINSLLSADGLNALVQCAQMRALQSLSISETENIPRSAFDAHTIQALLSAPLHTLVLDLTDQADIECGHDDKFSPSCSLTSLQCRRPIVFFSVIEYK